jgi:hypothetical protein
MKLKDFLAKLQADGKITQADFIAAKESAPDWDFPDKAIEAFESTFLTIDRAITDKSVHTRLKREILDPVDVELKPIIAFIDTLDRFKSSEIDKMTSTYDKIKAIQAAFPALIDKVKKAPETDEDTKKKLKTFEESNQELLQRIEKMNTDYAEKEKFFQTEADKKINGYRLNQELEKLANSIKFGKAYSDETIRKDITKAKLDSLRARYQNQMQLVDNNGQPAIQMVDKEGKPLFKDNSNTAVTINQLLEEEFKVYIKANNSGDDEDDKTDPRDTKRFNVKDDAKPRQGARTSVS